MMRRMGLTLAALVLVLATGVGAHQIIHGTVLRIDPQAGVIVFDDGRMVQTTADSMILSGNQRMAFATLQPGTTVAVYEGVPVVVRDGRYTAFGQWTSSPSYHHHSAVMATPSTVHVPPATTYVAPPSTVVVTTPATSTAYRDDRFVYYPAFETSGVVSRTDWTSGVIVMTDGRTIHVDNDSQVLVNGHPTLLGGIRPGTPVVVRSTKPFWGSNAIYAPLREVASGQVVRIDSGSAIVLSDGRVVPTAPGTVVMVDNRPVQLTTLQPGTYVVVYDHGRAFVVDAPAASPPLYPDAGLRERETERPSGQ